MACPIEGRRSGSREAWPAWLGLLALASSVACTPPGTSLLLDIDGPNTIEALDVSVVLQSGGSVDRNLPLDANHRLPSRIVVELPDVETTVTVSLHATVGSIDYATSAMARSRPHRQVRLPLSFFDTADLSSASSDGGVDQAVGDLAGVDQGGGDQAGADLTGVPPTGDLSPALSVVAGNYGGAGDHDDVGGDARFDSLAGGALVGNTFYVADYWTGHLRTVDVVTGQTGTVALLDGVGSATFTLDSPVAMAYDGVGSLYVGGWDHTVRRIDLATRRTYLVAGEHNTPGNTDAAGAAARFNRVNGLAFDGAGNLWVSDNWEKHLRKITSPGTTADVTTAALVDGDASATDMGYPPFVLNYPRGISIAGSTLYMTDGGGVLTIDLAQAPLVVHRRTVPDYFSEPGHVLLVGADLWVTDNVLNALWKIPASGPPELMAGSNGYSSYSKDGVGLAGRFQRPGFLSTANGKLYLPEAYTVRSYDLTTQALVTIAGRGSSAGNVDGTSSLLDGPHGLRFDGVDTVYFTEMGGYRVKKLAVSSGQVTTIAGNGGYTHNDGTGLQARFYEPSGIELDKDGNLYVADALNHCIRKITPAAVVSTIVGMPGMARPDGEAVVENADGLTVKLSYPRGLAYDAGRNLLFVADTGSALLRVVDLASATFKISTLAGSYTTSGAKDGTGTGALFGRPMGLAYDAARQLLYVADHDSHLIRKVDVQNLAMAAVTTLSGLAYSCGKNDGTFDATLHCGPVPLALDPTGNVLFVGNEWANTVQRLDLVAGVAKTVVGLYAAGFVRPGALPARIQAPRGLAVLPSGLLLTDEREHSILHASGVMP